MTIIGYALIALGFVTYGSILRAIFRLVAETRQLKSGARFNRFWWTPAWKIHPGHRFLSEIPNAQTSPGYYFDTYPERMQKSPGMEMTGYDLVHFFARNIAAQFASLKMALYDSPQIR